MLEILRGRRECIPRQLVGNFREALDGRFVAPDVQRERGVVVLDSDDPLLDDVAGINRIDDRVPGDAVRRFLVEQGP